MGEMPEGVQLRTPITEAVSALQTVEAWRGKVGNKMEAKYRRYMADNPECDFWKSPPIMKKVFGSLNKIGLVSMASTIQTLALMAIQAEEIGKHEKAWAHAADARYWAGILQASWASPAATLAKLRHAETDAMAADAVEYWHKNIDPRLSNVKAADMLERVVPLSHKTLKQKIAAEKKKHKKQT